MERIACLKTPQDRSALEVEKLELKSPRGQLLLEDLNLSLKQGQSLLIRGPSGCGKSTLIKAIAGIWPYADGEVHYIHDSQALFLSQKPYLPQGTLRLAASYPSAPETEGQTEHYFKLLGLEHLIPHLDEVDIWSHLLTLGEQKRVAVVRALINKPPILFLGEARSAMDEPTENLVYYML